MQAPVHQFSPDHAEDLRLHRQFRRMTWFWTVILYVSIGLCLLDTYNDQTRQLSAGQWSLLLAALVAFCAMYHGYFWRDDNWWPMPARRALIYFGSEIALFALIVWVSPRFDGIGYTLLAHACSVLHWRRWFLPHAMIFLIMAWANDMFAQAARGQWDGLASFSLSYAIIIGIFIGFYILSRQRYRLASLVRELSQAKAQLEQSAAQTEELAALRERTRLARDMHDSIGHALVVVNVKLEAAQRLYRRDMARGDNELEQTRALVRETMADLRRSLADLRTPIAGIDLPATLRQIAADAESRTPLAITLDLDPCLPVLSAALNETIARIVREAVVNIERHAAAASVSISVAYQGDSVLLRVLDDGSGIRSADLARPGHFGVLGMRERVEAVNGTFCIASCPGGGTQVEARLPLAAPESEQSVGAFDTCVDR